MRNDFYNAYEARMNEKYRTHVERKYYPFIELILKELPLGYCLIGEFGCGAANISRVLAKAKPEIEHYLIDWDHRMLLLADENMRSTNSSFSLYIEDLLDPPNENLTPNIHLIHSHGVLEHFSDAEIRTIIGNQLRLANTLVHYVPGAKYQKPSFGDERLLTTNQWQQICSPDEIVEFNDGYDLVLIWRKV